MNDSTSAPAVSPEELRPTMLSAAAVFIAALLVRIVYLVQSSDNPTFFEPIVDSYVYHQAALALADGRLPTTNLFWQPIFYPCFLAGFYSLLGPHLWLARLFQAVLGSAACVLLFWAGRLALSRKEGLLAGLMLAFCGPVVFYETEPLAEGWALFWVTALMTIFILMRRRDSPGLWLAAGLCGSLAMLARPPLLPFFALAAAIRLFLVLRAAGLREAITRAVFLAVSFGLPIYATGYANHQLTGHFGLLPYSSGINLYIGNNPDWERTVLARPGVEWNAILRLAEDHTRKQGLRHPLDRSAFYHAEVRRYIREQPRLFIRGLALKTLRLLNSRELPRNEDPYLFRRWSPLLAALLWKLGPFGFPFGVILPLAILGLATAPRRIPMPVWALLLTYPAAIVMHFVSSRYRILLLPGLLLPAAAALAAAAGLAQNRQWRRLLPALGAGLGLAAATAFPTRFPEEPPGVNYEAELHRCLGRQAYADNRLATATRELRRAIELRPDFADAINELSCVQLQEKRFDEALATIDQALAIEPGNALYLYNRGLVHLLARRLPEAEADFRRALELDPGHQPARGNLAILLHELGRHEESIQELKRALADSPENARLRTLMRLNLDALDARQSKGEHP